MLGRKKKKKSRGKGDELPKLEFRPKIADAQQQQGVLIACRSIEQYPATVILAAQAIKARADQILDPFQKHGIHSSLLHNERPVVEIRYHSEVG